MVYGLWFMVYDSWLMIYGLGFRVKGLRVGVEGSGIRGRRMTQGAHHQPLDQHISPHRHPSDDILPCDSCTCGFGVRLGVEGFGNRVQGLTLSV